MILPLMLRPFSRGKIQLRSKSPNDPPIIQPNYLTDERDVSTLTAGLKIVWKMSQTETLKKSKIHPIVDKYSCGAFDPFSVEYFECSLKHWSFSIYHAVGTSKMGPESDPFAVVDSELKIHGVINLRVIDASIMPTIVGGNTNAPTIMIGEKGADMIIKEWEGNTKPKSYKMEYKTKIDL